MAKGKSSRKERRHQRQKSERAREHGLPSRPPERPQKLGRQESGSTAGRARSRDEDEDAGSGAQPPEAGRSAVRRYLERVRDLPTAGKLAVLAVLGVIVLAIVSGMRDRTTDASREAEAPSTPPAALPSAVVAPETPEPMASIRAPAPPEATPAAEAPLAPTSSQAAKPKAMAPASSSVTPAASTQTAAPKPPAPKREDNPY
jgi:hypothetical protein